MTHIYYADQKIHDSKAPPVNAGTSWIDSFGYIFWFLKVYMRFRLYRLVSWVPIFIREGIAGFLGQLFLFFSPSNRMKVEQSFLALYPSIKSSKQIGKLYSAHCAYMGKLFLDFLNGLPINIDLPVDQFISYENAHLLDRELAKKKGVIIPVTHLGQLVHALYALMKNPKKYTVATVIYTPHLVTYEYTNRNGFNHVYLYASTSYAKIAPFLERHLKQNHIVVLFHDFGTKKQLRVPFWDGKFPYLLHTPQSIIKLHLETGASILPCLNTPDNYINRSRITFLENRALMDLVQTLKNERPKPKLKVIHGALSTEINKMIYPTIRKYAHVWEQLPDFAIARTSDSLHISKVETINEILNIIIQKMKEIINQSYEPLRNDEQILSLIDNLEENLQMEISSKGLDSTAIKAEAPYSLDLSLMNTRDEFRVLIEFVDRNCFTVNNKLQKFDSWEKFKQMLLEIYYS
ncbi:MAG: LpxL/LpxP family acyltransferase [Promethearchaeota archaeon]